MRKHYFTMLWRNLFLEVAIAEKHPPVILVVEDDEDNLLYITNALNLFQYRYITARNAIEGLALAIRHQPDLILLDLKMPHTSGFELIEMLKLNSLTVKIPVIAVTALASTTQKTLILESGFSNYLIKPYFLEDLEQIVGFHLAKTLR